MSLFDEDDELEELIEEVEATPDPVDAVVAEAKADPKNWVRSALADFDKLMMLAQLRLDDLARFKLLDIRLKDEARIANRQNLLSAVKKFADDIEAERRTFTPTPESVTPAVVEPPAMAAEPDLLEAACRVIHRRGVSGEDANVKLLYLGATSRLLDRVVSMAVKGQSATGKSWLTEKVLELFPPEAFFKLTGMSEHALAYSEEPFKHRMLVLFEADAMNNEYSTYLLRSLISENCVRYATVDKDKDGVLRSRVIDREGPTGLITTTTRVEIHAENETRLISLTTNDSREQTRRIMRETARQRANGLMPPPVDDWWKLQRWLAQGDVRVAVPYGEDLAELIPPHGVRLRRDFNAVLSLIQAHALLHRVTREIDVDGHVVATAADYAAVRELLEPVLAEALGVGVDEATRAAVAAVKELEPKNPGGVTTKVVAAHLDIDRQAAVRRLRKAAVREFILNNEDRRNHAARWQTNAEVVPEDMAVLPTVEALRSVIS